MIYPFQCLLYVQLSYKHFLLAAAGSVIYTFDIDNGLHVCTWSPLHDSHQNQKGEALPHDNDTAKPDVSGTPPKKRPKLSPSASVGSSVDIVLDKQSNNAPSKPTITKMVASQNGKHVAVITGEDKCLRVFELSSEGNLNLFSERTMPKRPCALAITSEDSTILSADKFGDVYALPLLGKAYNFVSLNGEFEGGEGHDEEYSEKAPFMPTANSLTVHTKRNRDALQQQQTLKTKRPQKKLVLFEHQLILGHVSLLTDIACASLPCPDGGTQEYILTCDRDEHIRISRGLPQAHIIEGFCLGHISFISKICVLSPLPHLLVSGGGDDEIFVWDWPSGKNIQRVNIKDLVESFKKCDTKSNQTSNFEPKYEDGNANGESIDHIAVSNIVFSPLPQRDHDLGLGRLFVTVEGVPAIFMFRLTKEGRFEHVRTRGEDDNIIDLVALPKFGSIVYSFDPTHRPISTTELANAKDPGKYDYLGSLCVYPAHDDYVTQYDVGRNTGRMNQILVGSLSSSAKDDTSEKKISESLYGLESLRKRGNEDSNET